MRPSTTRPVVLALAALAVAPAAAAGRDYGRQARVDYIHQAIGALLLTPRQTLGQAEDFIGTMERNRCRSSFARLRIECLVKAAHRRCRSLSGAAKKKRCLYFSDLIIANRLSEKEFISTGERYAIMKEHADYRAALNRELMRRHAAMVVDFRLSPHFRCQHTDKICLAEGIDDYCLESADRRAISWQQCAAAITWSVGIADH